MTDAPEDTELNNTNRKTHFRSYSSGEDNKRFRIDRIHTLGVLNIVPQNENNSKENINVASTERTDRMKNSTSQTNLASNREYRSSSSGARGANISKLKTRSSSKFFDPHEDLSKGRSSLTKEELNDCRNILLDILPEEEKRKKFKEFSKKHGNTDIYITAYENFSSFENNIKAPPMLLKSIALVLWETVNTTTGRGGVNFPPEIVAAIKKDLESDSINLNLFSGAKEYLFELMVVRLIPPYRPELALSNVVEQIEKIKIEKPVEKEKEKEKEISKSKKSRLSMALLSPRRVDTNQPKFAESNKNRKKDVIELSWIEKQRREKELNEGKNKLKKKKNLKVEKNKSRGNPMAVSHISWRDEETLAALRNSKTNSEKVAESLIAELDLSCDQPLPESIFSPPLSLNTPDSKIPPPTTNRSKEREKWGQSKSKSAASIPSPPSSTFPAISNNRRSTQHTNEGTRAFKLNRTNSVSGSQHQSSPSRSLENSYKPSSTKSSPAKVIQAEKKPLPLIVSQSDELNLSSFEAYKRSQEKENIRLSDRDSDSQDTVNMLRAKLQFLQQQAKQLGVNPKPVESLEEYDNASDLTPSESGISGSFMDYDIADRSSVSLDHDLYKSEVDHLLDLFQAEEEQHKKEERPLSERSESNRFVVLRKLGATRGGVKVRLPPTIEELIDMGSKELHIKGVKVREYETEAAILDISAVESEILFITTAEEERMF